MIADGQIAGDGTAEELAGGATARLRAALTVATHDADQLRTGLLGVPEVAEVIKIEPRGDGILEATVLLQPGESSLRPLSRFCFANKLEIESLQRLMSGLHEAFRALSRRGGISVQQPEPVASNTGVGE
jgi:hypothetical protein